MRQRQVTEPAGGGGARRLVLVGVARSGTSWLGHALGRAQGVRFYYEPDNVDADPAAVASAGRRGFGPYPVIDSDRDAGQFAPLWDLVFSGRLPFALRERRRLRPAAMIALRLPRSVRDPLVRGAALAFSSQTRPYRQHRRQDDIRDAQPGVARRPLPAEGHCHAAKSPQRRGELA